MTRPRFDPDDPGCGPAIIDPGTGRVYPDDHPVSRAARKVWEEAPLEEKRAFYQVTAHNSRDPEDLRLTGLFQDKITAALSN